MNLWKASVVALAFGFGMAAVGVVAADAAKDTAKDAKAAPKTVTGKSSCGGCSGTVKGCCVMLTDKNGDRWILRGDKAKLKTAFDARHGDKKMTATYTAQPTTKKDKDGKEFKEITVSEVKIGA